MKYQDLLDLIEQHRAGEQLAVHWWMAASDEDKEQLWHWMDKMHLLDDAKAGYTLYTLIGYFAQLGFQHIALLAEEIKESN